MAENNQLTQSTTISPEEKNSTKKAGHLPKYTE